MAVCMVSKLWLYIGLMVLAIAIGVGAAHEFYSPRFALQKEVAKRATAVAIATQKSRVVEQTIVTKDNAADAAYLKGLQDENQHLRGANSRLASRLDSLRGAPRGNAGGLSGHTSADSVSVGTVFAALPDRQREQLIDALISFGGSEYALASEADATADRVTACQQQLTARTASGSM